MEWGQFKNVSLPVDDEDDRFAASLGAQFAPKPKRLIVETEGEEYPADAETPPPSPTGPPPVSIITDAQRERAEASRIAALERLHKRQRAEHEDRVVALRGGDPDREYRPVHPLLLPSTRAAATPVVWGLAYMEKGALVAAQFLDRGIHESILAMLVRQPLAVYYPGDMMALSRQYLGDRVGEWRMLPDDLDAADEVVLVSYDPRTAMEGAIADVLQRLLRNSVPEAEAPDFSVQRRPRLPAPQTLHPIFDPADEDWAMYKPTEADTRLADFELSKGAVIPIPEGVAAPNLTHMGLINYMREATFTPSRVHFDAHAENAAAFQTRLSIDTVANQMKSHDRMLNAGTTQAKVADCSAEIKQGTLVRYRLQYKRDPPTTPEERRAFDTYNKSMEPDGSATWSHRWFVVREIVESADDLTPTTYKLSGHKRAFYRIDLCPVFNIEIGAFVRIRLAANVYYRKQMEQRIRTSERHTRYNHKFSRTIFKVDGTVTQDAEGDPTRYFLSVAWDAGTVYPLAAWETDPKENRWAEEHLQGDFRGYLTSDLLRVDQQTALKMETPTGREEYGACLAKINKRFPAGVSFNLVEPRPRADGVDPATLQRLTDMKERTVKWLFDENYVTERHGAYVIDRLIQGGELWHDLRALLATASDLERWAKGDPKLDQARVDLSRVPAVQWGKIAEPFGRMQYAKWLASQANRTFTVREIGMVIDRTMTMAASPDGWVYESALVSSEPPRLVGAVEIKCPTGSFFRTTPVDWSDPGMWKSVEAAGLNEAYFDAGKLKRGLRKYYYQCLANLYLVEDLEWIDFVVYLPENNLPGNRAPNNAGVGFENMFIHRFNKSDAALLQDWRELEGKVRAAYDESIPGLLGKYETFAVSHMRVTL